MTANDARFWKFSDAIADDSIIECSDCNQSSPLSEWIESGAWCEDCGDEHAAMVCPKCATHFDHVKASEFKVMKPHPA